MIRKVPDKRGSALILATISVLIVCGLVGAMIFIGVSYSNGQKINIARSRGDAVTIEAVERYRIELYSLLRESGLPPRDWLDFVREIYDSGSSETDYNFAANPRKYIINQYAQPVENSFCAIKHYTVKVWISAVSDEDISASWLDISGEITLNGIVVQVTQRFSFDPPPLYDMALHTAVVNCMCCHLEIHGDVGSLGDFRPGWGNEGGQGANSGYYSRVYGDLYAKGGLKESDDDLKYALKQSGDSGFDNYFLSGDGMKNLAADHENLDLAVKIDPSVPFKINGMSFYGEIYTAREDIEDRLPEDEDGDGISEFPVLLPEQAMKNACGKIVSAALLWAVPMGIDAENRYDLNDGLQDMGLSGISRYFNGHLVLVGSKSNPIEIEGAVVVTGDIVIKGYVKGQGVLYSGRNIYIAGDLIYENPPQCYWRLPKEQRINAAKEDISNGADELRLAARNTIAIGDWTYKNADGRKFPVSKRQGYDFYRKQFGFDGSGHFRAGTACAPQELIIRDGAYYNDNREKIASSQVVTLSGDDYYDCVFSPSLLKPDGSLFMWMTGQQYRDLLGEENIAYSSWRGKFSGTASEIIKELRANGFSEDDAQLIWDAWPGGHDQQTWMFYKSGTRSSFTLRVIFDTERTQPFQIGRIDAFLYAHRRIAGKTSAKNLVINGGLIAEKIGVLAPGHRRFFWMGYRYRQIFGDVSDRAISRYPNAPYHYYKYNDHYLDGRGGHWGVMTIHYDYRIKSGGEGFDLLEGTLARRIFTKKSYRRK